MKKYIQNIKEYLFIYNVLFLLIFILTTLILRVFNIRFRIWFSIFVIILFFLVSILSFINFLIKNHQRKTILIASISIIIFSNFLVLAIFSSNIIVSLLKDFVPTIFIKEYLVTLDNKKYVAIQEENKVCYYDYYGFFLVGTNLKVLGPITDETNEDPILYTYFNDLGQVYKKDQVTYSKDNDGNIISEKHDTIFPIEEEIINPEYYLLADDEEVLYERKFDDIIIRFTIFDVALGQNNLVHVVVSENGGKSFRRINGAWVQVSQKARFTFVDKQNGFAINNGMIRICDSYGMRVTTDGGLTFKSAEFKYKNNEVEYLNIIDVPYLENNILKLKCSITVHDKKREGYEKQEIIFISNDKGLTWFPEK